LPCAYLCGRSIVRGESASEEVENSTFEIRDGNGTILGKCFQEARAEFRRLLCETTVQVDALGKKLGSCVERARPYYEARMRAKEVSRGNNLAYVSLALK